MHVLRGNNVGNLMLCENDVQLFIPGIL